MSEEKKQKGRPSLYSEQLVDEICEKIATSNKGLHSIIAENQHFPSFGTVFSWLQQPDKKYFLDKYTHARELQAEFLADEMIRISEHTEEDHTAFTGANVVQRDRLRIETRKWIASKLKPKVYGDKIDITTKDQPINNLPDLSKLTYEQLKELANIQLDKDGSTQGNSEA